MSDLFKLDANFLNKVKETKHKALDLKQKVDEAFSVYISAKASPNLGHFQDKIQKEEQATKSSLLKRLS